MHLGYRKQSEDLTCVQGCDRFETLSAFLSPLPLLSSHLFPLKMQVQSTQGPKSARVHCYHTSSLTWLEEIICHPLVFPHVSQKDTLQCIATHQNLNSSHHTCLATPSTNVQIIALPECQIHYTGSLTPVHGEKYADLLQSKPNAQYRTVAIQEAN